MAREIALQDVLSEGGYEASLITTYSIFPPFYEEFVLPRLRAAGSRFNIVLADTDECSKSLASREGQVMRAGTEYVLFPVRSAGAFHPKVMLFVGRGKCSIAVGSHNLTLSGFGYNRELTTFMRFKPSDDTEGVNLARAVWNTVKHWVSDQPQVPRAVHDAVLQLVNFANWLEGPVSPQQSAPCQFYAQTLQSGSLWAQLRSDLPGRVRRVIVLGPFFDKRLSFLEEISRSFSDSDICVGIDPATVELSVQAKAGSRITFRDASGIYRSTGYLHAKALYFDAGGDQDTLVIGSANPSAPAWLTTNDRGNQEAVVVHRGRNAREAARSLGLADVPSLREITQKDWKTIHAAQAAAEDSSQGPLLVIATEVEDGLAVPRAAFARGVPYEAAICDVNGEVLTIARPLNMRDDSIIIPIDVGLRRDATSVRFQAASGIRWLAFIHRPVEIRNLAQSSKQAKLKEALSGLGGDKENIGKLIATIESVIFEQPDAAEGATRATSAKANEGLKGGRERPESLEVELNAQKKKRSLRRILETGDLAYLLDVLLRQLGVGLERREASLDEKGRSEEEQVSQDDLDEPPQQKGEADDAAVAKLCRGKVRRVVLRLSRQLEQAAETKSRSPTILLQLVAVLALLRELRTIEKNPRWLKIHQTLVNPDDLERLLEDVLAYLFGKKYQLYEAIVTVLGDERFDEIARMKGLLIWLAWECGVKLDERFSIAEEPEDVERRVQDKAALLEFAMIMQADSLAQAEATESITRTASSGRAGAGAAWLSEYSRWAARVEAIVEKLPLARGGHSIPLKPGDLAVIVTVNPKRPRVVAGSARDGVALVDFGEESFTINYERNRVQRVG